MWRPKLSGSASAAPLPGDLLVVKSCFGDCILGYGRHKTSLFIRMMLNAGRREGTSVATTSPPSTDKLSTPLEGDCDAAQSCL